jgi:hypothetical protein
MVLAMDGDPLPATLPRRQPQYRAKDRLREGTDHERPMGEGAMQVNRGGDDRDLTDGHADQRGDPELN